MQYVIRAALIALALLAAGPAFGGVTVTAVNAQRLQQAIARFKALEAQEQAALRRVQLARTPAQRSKALIAAQISAELTRQALQSLQALSRDNRR